MIAAVRAPEPDGAADAARGRPGAQPWRSRMRITRRIAAWVSEKLAILLSTICAARPAFMTSTSLSVASDPLRMRTNERRAALRHGGTFNTTSVGAEGLEPPTPSL